MRGKPPPRRHRRQHRRIIPARAGQTWLGQETQGVPADHPRACGANRPSAGRGWRRAGSSPRVRGKLGFLVDGDFPGRIIPARAGQTSRCTLTVASRPDHPRACGANLSTSSNSNSSAGSSPRVRGKRPRARDRVDRRRIIPARAGQTSTAFAPAFASSDHPRACGANARPTGHHDGLSGSSPRVRGKRCPAIRVVTRMRIIPARAGQTARSRCRCRTARDHPRACGANGHGQHVTVDVRGSSPRVRGKLRRPPAKTPVTRIIPARAGQTSPPCRDCRAHPDHPRACGANSSTRPRKARNAGSSPRVRGKQVLPVRRGLRLRIIPARAGQTKAHRTVSRNCSDHPRACGANGPPRPDSTPPNGSSPRVRGKHDIFSKGGFVGRIIPARAGQTRRSSCRYESRPDHPRACGANLEFAVIGNKTIGSSPRVRGKRRNTRSIDCCGRIIPARAGQTASECCSRCRPPDHPRACGANLLALKAVLIVSGSSPRVRGKLAREPVLAYVDRIIPARAGQTRTVQAGIVVRADHPRACGANFKLSFALTVTSGSSPRVRGKHHGLLSAHARRRIIPARAGQTRHPIWFLRRRPDHPRACGANQPKTASTRPKPGSSPRVRGKLELRATLAPPQRIIPARAGQTNPRRPVHGQNPDHPRACGANLNLPPYIDERYGSSPRVRGKLVRLLALRRSPRIIPARAGQTIISWLVATGSADHPRACGANGPRSHDTRA